MKIPLKIPHEVRPFVLGSSIFVLLLLGGFTYAFIRIHSLSTQITTLKTDLIAVDVKYASTTYNIYNTLTDNKLSISSALSAQQQNVGAIQQQLGGFQNQVGSLSGTLTNLQKLSQTDPELLKKYSKAYFLNENYVPARLSEIPLVYEYSSSKQLLVETEVLPHLIAMITAASSTGISLYAFSAYRSFAEQRALKGDYTMTYGAGTANSFSADQGYSEHQLGTALDMMTTGIGGVLDERFDGTAAFQWMVQNAYKYGFILSYPKNNGYFVYEPWHWRFVGVKLATDLHNQGNNFYDWDQRKIDEYLVNIFD